MALKSIGLTQSLNATDDPRANIAIIDERSSQLNGAFTNNIGSCQHGGVTNLHKKVFASTESVKTIDDNGELVELKSGEVFTMAVSNSIPTTAVFSGIAYGSSKFVATPWSSGTGSYSTDGITWQDSNGMPGGASQWVVCYGNGKFVAKSINPGGTTAAYSTDGITWSASTTIDSNIFLNIAYLNGYYICVGTNKINYSINGVDWTSVTISGIWYSITYGAGKYVLCSGAQKKIAYSTDLTNWTVVSFTNTIGDFISYGNGIFICVGKYSVGTYTDQAYSYDGVVWHTQAPPLNGAQSGTLNTGQTFQGDYFWIWPSIDTIMYSRDGLSWLTFMVNPLGSSPAYRGVSYNSGKYVFLNYDNNKSFVLSSPSLYYMYKNSNKIGDYISTYAINSILGKKQYDDVIFWTSNIYGLNVNGNTISVDVLDTNLDFVSNYGIYNITTNRFARFMRNATQDDTNKFIMYLASSKTYFIIDGAMSNSSGLLYGVIDAIFTSGYVLHATNKKVLVGNEQISNADGRAIGVWATYAVGAGSSTLIASKDGWFLSYNDGGTIGIVGVEKSGSQYQFVNYTVNAAGAFTAVNTPSLGSMIFSINGLYAEYEPYQSYSAFAAYTAFTKSGTGADGIHMLGYFSVIDRITIDNDVLYLRAVYNRGLKSCDSLSISYSNNYIGRQIGVSDVDFTFRPQFVSYGGNYKLLYKNLSGNLTYIVIDDIANCTTQFTKIKKNLYLLNTLDPYNLLDTQGNNLLASGADYNGAVQYSASTKEHLKIVNDYYETTYNNESGIAPEANETITAPYDQKFIYKAETHSYYVLDGSTIENDKFNSPAYTDDHGYIPIPAYSFPQNKFVNVIGEIYPLEILRLLNISFLNQIGNITYPDAQFFYLFGSNYMYDGTIIYLLDSQNQTVSEVCRAQGLSFVAFSQEMAYFFSYCDNSIWSFNGGRSLQKITQLHNLFPIDTTTLVTGDYSTRDNLLFLSKAGVNVFLYDKTISYYSDSTGIAFIGDSGVYYKKTTEIDQISPFKQDVNFNAMSLAWQSATFKTPGVIYSVNEILFYILSDVKGTGTITLTYYSFLEDNTITTQTSTRTIAATDYDSSGYLSLRFQPQQVTCYGFSIGLSTSIDIVIIDVSVDTAPLAKATVMQRKSA